MDYFNFNEFDSHMGLYHIMIQNVHTYVQYVMVNNISHLRGGGNNFFLNIHIRLKIILKQI